MTTMAVTKARTQAASSTSKNGSATIANLSGATCVISKDTMIKGSFTADQDVRMDGKVTGDVYCTKRLVMGETGYIEGKVKASDAIIMGKIEGEVIVKNNLHLKETAVIHGNITARQVTVEEGAQYNGECRIGVSSAP
jgi:cytoskeletal protein CcmA (bactofilin family)